MNAKEFEDLCRKLEHFETPEWAVEEILDRDLFNLSVVDPCCGGGVLSRKLNEKGYNVLSFDIHDWGYDETIVEDWLSTTEDQFAGAQFSVLMNPPFSKAEEFVRHAFDIGARKVVMFQRFSFWESSEREDFWNNYRPNRIYVCGNRADCWRYDLRTDEQGNRYDPVTGKKLSSTPTTHACFSFEKGHPCGTLVSHVRK